MTSADDATNKDVRRHRPRWRRAIAVWAILVALVLLWQMLAYRGAMALAAEWQFDTFGRYYPALTYVLLVALLASPLWWLARDRPAAEAPVTLPGPGFIRALLGVALGCAAASALAALAMLAQPDGDGAAARVTIGSAAATTPAEGATVLVGDAIGDRVAGLSEDVFVARRSFRFVPVLAPDGADRTVRYFAEIDAANTLAVARRDGSLTGILKHDALPGELVRLFRYAGIDVAREYHVLFASRDSLQWPYRVLAVELALVALLCGGVVLALHRRRERLRVTAAGKKLPPG